MKVIGIYGDKVEVLWFEDGEIEYIDVDDFIEQHGAEELYGDEIKITECEDGVLYEC